LNDYFLGHANEALVELRRRASRLGHADPVIGVSRRLCWRYRGGAWHKFRTAGSGG